MTGQRAAQGKNCLRQWGQPFGRAFHEICPAISTHPHRGGDRTTTTRQQDAGAVAVESRSRLPKLQWSRGQGRQSVRAALLLLLCCHFVNIVTEN